MECGSPRRAQGRRYYTIIVEGSQARGSSWQQVDAPCHCTAQLQGLLQHIAETGYLLRWGRVLPNSVRLQKGQNYFSVHERLGLTMIDLNRLGL